MRDVVFAVELLDLGGLLFIVQAFELEPLKESELATRDGRRGKNDTALVVASVGWVVADPDLSIAKGTCSMGV